MTPWTQGAALVEDITKSDFQPSRLGSISYENFFRHQRRQANTDGTTECTNVVEKGRESLVQAQRHIQLLEKYLSCSPDHSTLHLQRQTEASSNPSPSFEQVETPTEGSLLPTESLQEIERVSVFDSQYFITEKLVREGRRRVKRDAIITAFQLQENQNPRFQSKGLPESWIRTRHRCTNTGNQPCTSKRSIDPGKLLHLHSTAFRATKLPQDKIRVEQDLEMKMKHEFKALPLPNGIHVNNDPYALTAAAIGKRNEKHARKSLTYGAEGSHRGLLGREGKLPTMGFETKRVDASSILEQHQFVSCQKKIRNRRGRLRPKIKVYPRREIGFEQLYDNYTQKIPVDVDTDIENGSSENENQDVITLHQQVSKLQASWRQKHAHCVSVITQIDGIESNESMTSRQDSTRLDVSYKESTDVSGDSSHHLTKLDGYDTAYNQDDHTALYNRQMAWFQDIENWRIRERTQRDLKDTGASNQHLLSAVLKHTAQSWLKAKAAHNEAVQKMRSKENETRIEKEAKAEIIRARLSKELEHVTKNGSEKILATKKLEADEHLIQDSKDDGQNNFKTTFNEIHPSDSMSTSHDIDRSNFKTNDTTIGLENDSNQNVEKEKKYLRISAPTNALESTNVFSHQGKSHFCGNQDIAHHPVKSEISIIPANAPFPATMKSSYCRRWNAESTKNVSVPKRLQRKHVLRSTNPYKRTGIPALTNRNRFWRHAVQTKVCTETATHSKADMRCLVKETLRVNESEARADLHVSQDSSASRNNQVMLNQDNRHVNSILMPAKYEELKVEPYQRYESGKVPFFDKSSSSDKGRFRVYDAKHFIADSIRRVTVPWDDMGSSGVMLLAGKRYSNLEGSSNDSVITVIFDRNFFNETKAIQWWHENRGYIVDRGLGGKEL